MAQVTISLVGMFECPTCGNESETYPDPPTGKGVVCGYCGRTHKVKTVCYLERDWNAINRGKAKDVVKHNHRTSPPQT